MNFNIFKIKSIGLPLYLYWFIFLLVQNIVEYDKDSLLISLFKVVLLGYLVYGFFSKFKFNKINFSKLTMWGILSIFLILNMIMTGNGGNAIFYLFPIILSFLVYIIGEKYKISLNEYVIILNFYIICVLYIVVYGLILTPNVITGFSSLTQSYGNEFKSFLFSNHELGMYLVFAIISCLFCYHFHKKNKIMYICFIFILLIGLVLTFSRTSMLALAIFLFVYILTLKNKKLKFVISIFIILLILLALDPSVSDFIINIVFKSKHATSGREEMLNFGINYFQNLDFVDKCFGVGAGQVNIISKSFGHSTLHNGFLQVLLTFGYFGLIILFGLLINSIINAINICKINKQLGLIILGLCLTPFAFMGTNTALIFNSPIDSYMLTLFPIILPKLLHNYLKEEK